MLRKCDFSRYRSQCSTMLFNALQFVLSIFNNFSGSCRWIRQRRRYGEFPMWRYHEVISEQICTSLGRSFEAYTVIETLKSEVFSCPCQYPYTWIFTYYGRGTWHLLGRCTRVAITILCCCFTHHPLWGSCLISSTCGAGCQLSRTMVDPTWFFWVPMTKQG